ncbi:MAG: hypothetical protein P8J55_08025 [Pseudomonadales bacterium]|nr:hypothetical protein [Pseudomonadales bacterium]
MFVRLAIIFLIAAVVFAAMRMLLRKKKLSVKQFFQLYFLVLVGLALLYLGLFGVLHPLFAVFGAILPFLARVIGWVPRGFQLFTIFKHFGGSRPNANASSGQVSEINTRFLHMVLFHDTGMMDGEVLQGQFAGAKLGMLEIEQLLALREVCRADPGSMRVLEAFLDREHTAWREQTGAENNSDIGESSELNERQAYEILGLPATANREQVVQAHRRLMQKLHPDHGGSTYLAARVNQAKALLLNKLEK